MNLIKFVTAINTIVERFGPKAAAIGILLVIIGQVLQGKFEEINGEHAVEALIALGLWGARANKVTSEKSGAKNAEKIEKATEAIKASQAAEATEAKQTDKVYHIGGEGK